MKVTILLSVLCVLSLCVFCVHGIEDPEDFVNLLAGTFTDGRSYSSKIVFVRLLNN